MFNLITFFLLSPILWLGLLGAFLISYQRIRAERRQFSIAINNHYSEISVFLKNGLLVGLLSSGIVLILGITVDFAWLSWVMLLLILSLLLCFWFWDSGLTLILGLLLAWYFPKFHFLPVLGFSPTLSASPDLLPGGLAVAGLALISLGLILAQPPKSVISPQVKVSKRGIRQASYHIRRLYLMPLFLIVPGDSFGNILGSWPFLSFGQHQFSLLILPLVIGFNFHLKKRLPAELQKMYKYYVAIGIELLILAILARILHWSLFFMILALVSVVGLRLYISYFLQTGHDYLVEPTKGIRVLAVQADTPAQKAGLYPGDVVLSVNDRPIDSQVQFYEMAQKNGTFIKLRVQTLHKDIKLAETAIYKDSPHELGLVTFPDKVYQESRRGS